MKFGTLDLEPFDAWSLFKLLDSDGGNAIDLIEFVEGCQRLRGTAKQIDVAELMTEHTWLVEEMSDFMNHVIEEMNDVKAGVYGISPPRVEKAKIEAQ